MLAGPTDSRSRTSRPGKAQPPPGINAAPCLMPSPGGAALTGPTDSRSRTSRPGKAQPPPGNKAAPCLMASPGGAALTGPTRCEPVRGPGRPGKVPAATRQNNGATGNVPARAALSRATVSMLFPDRLRSQYFFCAMSLMALGAHRAASRRRPLYPRAPASNIAAARSLRLIPAGFGSGRGSVPAKHGPQPASMRAAPAFRERLSDVEAASTGSFSSPCASGDLGL